MKKLVLIFMLLVAAQSVLFSRYVEQSWESMAENYSVPEWFQDGKIGVWTHWGVPSGTDENRPNDGSHYGRRMYGANEGETGAQLAMTETLTEWHTEFYGHPSEFGYEDLVPLFKAEKWDPDGLVRFFKDCGARFIMPVATHHDNFDMYDSFHPWNAVDMGPKRDTIQEWKDAARRHGLKFGVSTHLYWSPRFFRSARQYQKPGTLEWKLFNMDYDPKGYASQDSWNEHWYARCWELIDKYDPDMFNNDSPYPSEKTGKSLGLKLFSDFVNRDLEENNGEQTVVLSFKDGKRDRRAFTYNLERGSAGEIKPEPWMWATDLSGGWFYRKGAVNRMSIPVMVGNAVDAISKNGVVMLNVALRGDGTLPENQAAYLTTFRDFIKVCGEGIYGTRPWKVFGEGPLKMKDGRQGENHTDFCQEDIRFTSKNNKLYAFVLAKPTEDIVIKTLASGGLYNDAIGSVTLLGSDEEIFWKRTSAGLTIQLPENLPDIPVIGFRIEPAKSAKAKLKGSRPNIVLVMTDDQGMGDLSCMGNEVLQTPHIDRFHEKSIRFTDFQVSPTCAPTRAAIMSGRPPFKVGVTHTILQRERMALDVFTLPQALQSAGYSTGLFGKWHLGDEEAYLPINRGFDEVLMHGAGGIGQVGLGDFPPNKENVYFDNVLLHNNTIVQTKGYCTDLFFESALSWIKEQHVANNLYFAYVSLNAPHAPMAVAEKYKKRFLEMGYDANTAGRYGMIENIDDNFGLLMKKLKEWDALENTLVIFMTDNGATHLGGTLNGERVRHFNFNMSGGKNSPYEGGTHVPAFWYWKDVLGEGVDIDGLTAHIDLYKTFCELAAIQLPGKMQALDGRSLLPLLKNPDTDWPDRELFVHCGRWKAGERESLKYEKCAVRTERWRLVNNAQLYDIDKDPGETQDVAADFPEVVSRLRKSYDAWWESTLPLMVNEDLPRVRPEDQPFALRYNQKVKEGDIPFWEPEAY